MSLAPGTRLGPYEITDRIGAGGMGEVYRATDSTLGRDVAIKVLPEAFAQDAERLARFEREARTLASLSHPNIAIVFGFERVGPATDPANAGRALVMELVDGPTLADLILQGPMPLDEALPIAKQIAEALEAAHDHGIIHRDLKPANVKLRADGRVKVLDFGLAKALEPAAATSSAMRSMSPTITTPAMTQAGIVLGTAAYMSPEQARGKPVDKRADIWAFGCVLFEMLSGRRTIGDEETVSDTLASVLKGEPAWNALPADTPPRIRTLIERCLRKDVRRRLPDISEARIQIDEAAGDSTVVPVPGVTTRGRGYVWPAVAAVSLLTSVGLAVWIARTPAREDPTIRLDIHAPTGATPLASDGRLIEIGPGISPDGLTVAFLANVDGRRRLWVRPLDGESRPLDGTEDAERSAWSPDGRQIAFVTQSGLLKRVSVAGGPPTEICKIEARDITWAPGTVILVGGGGRPLTRVSPDTCDPQPATRLTSGELTHDYPHFLPDGRRFLYMSRHGAESADWNVYVGSLDSSDRVRVPGIHSGARYSTTGHLVFNRDGALMAQAFDAERLRTTGDAFLLANGVSTPAPPFSVSDTGSLAYTRLPSTLSTQLTWFDRSGKQTGPVAMTDEYRRIDLSSDDRFVAFDRDLDVFVLDTERGSTSRVVSTTAADFGAVWSPTNTAIAFGSSREPTGNAGPGNINAGNLYQRAIGIVQPDTLLLKTSAGKMPSDWSVNGYIAYMSRDDIWALKVPVSTAVAPLQVTNSTFRELDGRFSPDGQWIAYESNETGKPTDVYIQSFPDGSARQPLSTNGGSTPRWSRDGRELFYVAPDQMLMSVSIVRDGNGVRAAAPRPVFRLSGFEGRADYDVARDGRFLVNVPAANQTAPPLTVIHNWGASLTKK